MKQKEEKLIPFKDKSPKMREFQQLAAKALFGHDVEEGKCVCCGGDVSKDSFRDAISRREFEISGLCQRCQDRKPVSSTSG